MAGLDNLIDKITLGANEEVNKILETANIQASSIKKEADEKLKKEVSKIEQKNDDQCKLIREQLKSNAELKSRNNKLKTKQEVISSIFEDVFNELKNMSDSEYIDYIKSHLSSSTAKIVVVKDKYAICKENLEGIEIVDNRFVNSGFIEVTDDIEKNYTFDSKIGIVKEEVEGQLAKILFD